MIIARLVFRAARPFCVALSCLLLAASLGARTFSVAVYNLENFFDVDGVAAYEEFEPDNYTPAHLRTKVVNATEVVSRMTQDGKGPDIILFQEVELDQTPSAGKPDYAALLAKHSQETLATLLSGKVPADAADWPAEAWLQKAFQEKGLTGYTVVAGEDPAGVPYEDGHKRAIKNVVFTRFPVKAVRNHPIHNARNIIELQLDVDGHTLYVFSNHWKSGAGSAETEVTRVQNAQVLRSRLDEILRDDPHADIILGGDFNSQYNQKLRYSQMKETGLNDVLRSQGDVMALRSEKADLYNLWFDVPPSKRTSDVFRGEWGTLMQLIVSRGLFDYKGVQYVPGSMHAVILKGLNTTVDGLPLRWSNNGPAGSGFSDHFPICAQFQTVDDNDPARWVELKHPSDGSAPSAPLLVTKPKAEKNPDAKEPPAEAKLRDGTFNGKLFVIEGSAIGGPKLGVNYRGEDWEVYISDAEVRDRLRKRWASGKPVKFIGEVGQYKGRWQFVIREVTWVLKLD